MPDERQSSESDVLDIVRDVTFARAVVDKVAVLNLGRDLELACLQIGPTLQTLEDMGDEEKIGLRNELTEVARIRMPWITAVAMVMHILEKGITSNRLNRSAIEASLGELWSRNPSPQDAKAGSDEH